MPLPSLVGFEGNGWALAGVLFAILAGLAMRLWGPWRQVENEFHSARFEESQKHIRVLQQENKGLRERLAEIEDGWRERMSQLEKEYDEHRRECRKETEELHGMIRTLNDEMVGLRRMIAQNSQTTANFIGDLRRD